MKNLQLSLKTKWFEMTKSGIKTEDYREITPYWLQRLYRFGYGNKESRLQCCEDIINCRTYFSHRMLNGNITPVEFKTNTITLGYPKIGDKDRILRLEHKGIEIRTGNPDWGAEPGKLYFVIKHGGSVE